MAFLDLCIVSLVMGVVAIIGGMIPIRLSHQVPNFQYFSYFGMGILISTSLVIIIPEGVKTMTEALGDKLDSVPLSTYIGIPLIVGFFLMLLQDNLPILLDALNLQLKVNYTNVNNSEPNPDFTVAHGFKLIIQSSLTLGLLLHGFIDGISLGLSYALERSNMGIIMFVVIVVHKLPTSFSMTSILLKEGFSAAITTFHLVLFSLTTPIAALSTFAFIKISSHNSQLTIAILFLFSAGTFLYVIHHVMSKIAPEVALGDLCVEEDLHNSTSTTSPSRERAIEFAVTMLGACLPIIVSFFGDD